MITVRYSEGPRALSLKLPSRWLDVDRGASVEVTEEEAEALLQLPGWDVHPVNPPTPPTSLEDES